MIAAALLLAGLAQAAPAPAHGTPPTLKEALGLAASAHAARDARAARQLLRRAPHYATLVVAADLEAGLLLREGGAPAEHGGELLARARWTAGLAAEEGLPLVAEWAAALSDLDEQGLRRYRQGQARLASALELGARAGEEQRALELAISALDHALTVGDWWGAAQAWRERARLERGMSAFEEALVSLSQARLISRALGLVPDELDCVVEAAELAAAQERDALALELVAQALALRARALELGLPRPEAEAQALERLRASVAARASSDPGPRAR